VVVVGFDVEANEQYYQNAASNTAPEDDLHASETISTPVTPIGYMLLFCFVLVVHFGAINDNKRWYRIIKTKPHGALYMFWQTISRSWSERGELTPWQIHSVHSTNPVDPRYSIRSSQGPHSSTRSRNTPAPSRPAGISFHNRLSKLTFVFL